MRPATDQTGGEILQARQLDLQLAFMAACTLGEDFENQQGPVVDRQAKLALEIALLGRAQCLIEQDFLGAIGLGQQANFFGLARTHEKRRIGRLALAGQAGDRFQARGLGQKAEFFELPIEMGCSKIDPDQNDRGIA